MILILTTTTSDYLILDPNQVDYLILSVTSISVVGSFPVIEGLPLDYPILVGSPTTAELEGLPLDYVIVRGLPTTLTFDA